MSTDLGECHLWVVGVGSYLKEVNVPSSHMLIVSLYPVLPLNHTPHSCSVDIGSIGYRVVSP